MTAYIQQGKTSSDLCMLIRPVSKQHRITAAKVTANFILILKTLTKSNITDLP